MCLLIALVSAAAAQATYPGGVGRIAFSVGTGLQHDIWVMNADGSERTQLTSAPGFEIVPAWSKTGRIAYDHNNDIWAMNGDGSNQAPVATTPIYESYPDWSPDGTQIVFESRPDPGNYDLYKMNADGTGRTQLTNDTASENDPTWSPDGTKIAFTWAPTNGDREIVVMNADGSGRTTITNNTVDDTGPDWSPDGSKIAFSTNRDYVENYEVYTMTPSGGNPTNVTNIFWADSIGSWSPDGQRIAFNRLANNDSEILVIGANGAGETNITNTPTVPETGAAWEPIPTGGYPRPKGATPVRLSLVPAYRQCTAPDRTHGPPLAFPSCNSPDQLSSNLTVGTTDANGAAANFTGFLRYEVLVGAPGPPDDSDLSITAGLIDVRCAGATSACGAVNSTGGRDYTGQLQANATIRITDKQNRLNPGDPPVQPATMVDLPFPVSLSCSQTASTATGGSCSVMTSAAALNPGMIKDGQRQVVEMGQVRVDDGGPDGVSGTPDNEVFAVQGVFIP